MATAKRKHADPVINTLIDAVDSLVLLFARLDSRIIALENVNAEKLDAKKEQEEELKRQIEEANKPKQDFGPPIKRVKGKTAPKKPKYFETEGSVDQSK